LFFVKENDFIILSNNPSPDRIKMFRKIFALSWGFVQESFESDEIIIFIIEIIKIIIVKIGFKFNIKFYIPDAKKNLINIRLRILDVKKSLIDIRFPLFVKIIILIKQIIFITFVSN